MQTSNSKKDHFFVQVNLIPSFRVGEWHVEPFIKRLHRVEIFGKDKRERSSGEDKAVMRVVVGC